MASASPTYDLAGAVDTLFPGLVVQRQLLDAAAARYAAKGFQPLDATDVTGILAAANTLDQSGAAYMPTDPGTYPAALPSLPAGLKRFADSNPTPEPDNWSIERGRAVP